jgi:hypothetical protein
LKAIAAEVLQELSGASEAEKESEAPKESTTFNAQLAKITQIKTRQLHDYLKVCVLRLDKPETASGIQERTEDQLEILKAILSS